MSEKKDVIWKVIDPVTGLFFQRRHTYWSIDSKFGTVWKRRRDLTASFLEGHLCRAIQRHPQLQVVEYSIIEDCRVNLKDWRKV